MLVFGVLSSDVLVAKSTSSSSPSEYLQFQNYLTALYRPEGGSSSIGFSHSTEVQNFLSSFRPEELRELKTQSGSHYVLGYGKTGRGDRLVFGWMKSGSEPMSLVELIRNYLEDEFAKVTDEASLEKWKSNRVNLLGIFYEAKSGGLQAQSLGAEYRPSNLSDPMSLQLSSTPVLVRFSSSKQDMASRMALSQP